MAILIRILLAALLACAGYAQVRENPRTPAHPNPGRVLEFIEALKIGGESEGFIFEGADGLKIDADGYLYAKHADSRGHRCHLWKITPEGRIIADFFRQGEGPGEIVSYYDFALIGKELFLYDFTKRKIVILDTNGRFTTEFKLERHEFNDLSGEYGERLVFTRKNYPFERKTSRLYDVQTVIDFVSGDGKVERNVGSFGYRDFFISSAQGGGFMRWDPFLMTIGGNRLYVCATQEYRIQVYDIPSRKVLFSFTRDYPRVRHHAQDREKMFVRQHHAPERKYENDITGLHFDGSHLWVRTSTTDEGKGALYDLFDSEGLFVDSFFVDIRGFIIRVEPGFFYINVLDDNDLPWLVKYRIAEPLGAAR